MEPSDAELLERWRGGDDAAGQMLVERYYDAIDRFFANKIGVDGPDLVQETFKRLVEGLDRIREGGRLRSYLFSIAYIVLKGYFNKKRRERERAGKLADLSTHELDPSPRSLIVEREEQRLFLEALRRIEIERQCLLELFYWEQLGVADIAEILEIEKGTVQSRLFYARQRLEKKMAELADSPELLRRTISNLERWAHLCRLAMGRTERRPDDPDAPQDPGPDDPDDPPGS